jgi:dolichyl-phosphate beta-glucosyltransferase
MTSTFDSRLADTSPIQTRKDPVVTEPPVVHDLRTPLSVVIPAFNEAERLPATLEGLLARLEGTQAEIIVIDDGSDDDTVGVASSCLADWPNARCLRLPENRGKGAAVRHGVLEATGRNIVYMDADSATDLRDLDALVAALEHAHVAVGSRAAVGAQVDYALRSRAVMGRAYNGLARQLTGLTLRDTQCGFKAFRSPVAKLLFGLSTVDRFAFDIEVLHRASVMGFRIAEVPVRWNHVEGSKVRRVHDSFNMAADTIRTTRGRSKATVATMHVTHRGHEVDEAIASLPVRALVRRGHGSLEILLPPGREEFADVVHRHLRQRGVHAEPRERSGFELARPLHLHRWETTSDIALPPVPIVESQDLTKALRDSGRRLLRRGKYLAGHDPAFLPLLLRATPMGTEKRITPETDLVIEGFPRSGNTFAVFAMADASNGRLSVASHVHHPSQVKLAARRGLPTLLVIREPVPCLASYLIAGPHGRPKQVLKEYVGYHRELLPYLDDVVVADFDEVTSDFGAVVRRLNQRFGTDFPAFVHDQAHVDRVLAAVEAHHREVHPEKKAEFGVPRPSQWRSGLNERHRDALRSGDLADLVEEATHLRELYLSRR